MLSRSLEKECALLGCMLAWHVGSNVVSMFEGAGADSLSWPIGDGGYDSERRTRAMEAFAGFVRANPTAPAESLYRFAHGQGLLFFGDEETNAHHPDAWRKLPLFRRLAYEMFTTSLLAFDRITAAEIEHLRNEEMAAASARGDVPLGVDRDKVPEEDRMDALLPDPLALSDIGKAVMSRGPMESATIIPHGPKPVAVNKVFTSLEEAQQFLLDAGWAIAPGYKLVLPANDHAASVDERNAAIYLQDEWDFGEVINVTEFEAMQDKANGGSEGAAGQAMESGGGSEPAATGAAEGEAGGAAPDPAPEGLAGADAQGTADPAAAGGAQQGEGKAETEKEEVKPHGKPVHHKSGKRK